MPNADVEARAAPIADFSGLMEIAREAFQGGRHDEASRACRQIIDEHGGHPAAWVVLGATAWKEGDPDRAVEAFAKAVAGHKSNVEYRLMLANAYREQGRLDEAIETLTTALEISPHSSAVRVALGTAQVAAGQKEDGVANCRAGLHLVVAKKLREVGGLVPWAATTVTGAARAARSRNCSFSAARRFERARRLARTGEFERAVQVCGTATRDAPDYAQGAALLGYLLACAGEDVGALGQFEAATDLDPNDDDLQIGLARALSAVSRHDDALDVIERVVERGNTSREALCVKGESLSGMGRTADARGIFEQIFGDEPGNARAIYGLARCHQGLGAFDEARPWIDKLLRIQPDHARAYRDLAINRQLDVDGDQFARAKSLLSDGTLQVNQRLTVHFALAAAEADAGNADEAFRLFRVGNSLKNVVHSQQAHSEFVDKMCAAFDADFFRRTEGWGSDSERPIFILGMPRSGTTLVEQILASHARVFGAGELNDLLLMASRLPEILDTAEPFPHCAHLLTREAVQDLATTYLDKLARLSGGAERVSDKMPGNFLRVGLIAALLPNARIIHCRRDPQDTCLSIYFQNFAGHHPYGYDLSNLGHYYRQYERLMDHWHRVVPTPILDMPYEDVVADQEGMTRRLLEFCGLEWDERCLAFHENERSVLTSSFAQVRKPIYTSSVAKYKRYEKHLGPLRDALGIEEG